MSKYWMKMEILRASKKYQIKTDQLFISEERPAFFVNRNYYDVKTSSKHIFTEEEIQQISNLYRYNYRIGKSPNAISVSTEQIRQFLNLDSEVLTIHKNNVFIGCMVSILVPISIKDKIDIRENSKRFDFFKAKEDNLVFAYASFLVLEKNHRKKGLGMALIQESLQILYDNGGLGAYFINTVSRCDNAIPLLTWYYPLNLEKLDNCKYNYPREYKSKFILKECKENMIIRIDNTNEKIAYEFYMKYGKDKKVYFSPSFNYWKIWIKVFPTFIVKQEEIKGLFSFSSNNIWYPLHNTMINNGYLIICIGENILSSALLESKKYFDILNISEVGDIKSSNLINIFAQKSNKSYINFFNTTLSITASDFYVPLL